MMRLWSLVGFAYAINSAGGRLQLQKPFGLVCSWPDADIEPLSDWDVSFLYALGSYVQVETLGDVCTVQGSKERKKWEGVQHLTQFRFKHHNIENKANLNHKTGFT